MVLIYRSADHSKLSFGLILRRVNVGGEFDPYLDLRVAIINCRDKVDTGDITINNDFLGNGNKIMSPQKRS
ncbi:hypothetical protein ES703_116853 [subsurface metagenome]